MGTKKIFLIITALLTACTFSLAADRIHLITDRFWFLLLEQELLENPLSELKKSVYEAVPVLEKNTFRAGGRSVKVTVIDIDQRQSDIALLNGAVSQVRSGTVILSPILADAAESAAAARPDLVFIIPLFQKEGSLPENIIPAIMDYRKAYYDAGSWAASEGSEVKGLFFTGTNRFEDAGNSFVEGWSDVRGSEKLNFIEILMTDAADNDFINEFSSSVSDWNGIAAVFAGPYNEAVLSSLDGAGIRVITEHLSPWNSAGFNAAGSIELRVEKVISEIVKQISTDNYGEAIVIEAEFILHADE